MNRVVIACAASTFALAGVAYGQVWNEIATNGFDFGGRADSGDFPLTSAANRTAGVGGVLSEIRGSQYSSTEWDVYKIRVTDFMSFSATQGGFTEGNPESWLALFDGSGNAVTFSNDTSGAIGLSSANLSANGDYWLAVGGNGRIYRNAVGEDLFPWGNAPGEYAPSATMGLQVDTTGLNPAVGFLRFSGNRAYTITLRGADYSFVPAPGAAALCGLGGLLAIRRRR